MQGSTGHTTRQFGDGGSEVRGSIPPGPQTRPFWISFFGIDFLTRLNIAEIDLFSQKVASDFSENDEVAVQSSTSRKMHLLSHEFIKLYTFPIVSTKSLCQVNPFNGLFLNPRMNTIEYIARMESVSSDTMDYHGTLD